jgi:hypothetical protein
VRKIALLGLVAGFVLFGCVFHVDSGAKIRFYNNAGESYDVRLFKVSTGQDIFLWGIPSKQLSQEKAIDAGPYHIYWRKSSASGDTWTYHMERYYSNGDDKTETISIYGTLN